MAVEIQKKYLLGDYELDAGSHLLVRGGAPIALSKKRFQVLLFLVEERHRLVTRQELLERFWDGHEVYEENLTKCISEIRKALDDQKKPHQFIETVPAVGYRYVGPVTEEPPQLEPSVFVVERTRGVKIVVAEDDEQKVALVGQRVLPAQVAAPMHDRTLLIQQIKRNKGLAAIAVVVMAAAMFGLYKLFVSEQASRPREIQAADTTLVLRTMQVTSWAGLDLYPSFSPDRSAIAYSSDRSGSFEIYVKQLVPGGREIQITLDGQQNFEPAWSPDGKLIAYHSKNRGGVWLIPALGGVARQLSEFGSYPAWSPDGTLIAFQSAGIGMGTLAISSGAVQSSTIWVVAFRGGTPKQITQSGNPSAGLGSPTWSPDGKRIAFTAYDLSKPSEVWSVAADGSKLQLIARHGIEPVYSPNGKSVYFVGAPMNLGYGVWKTPISTDDGGTIGDPEKIFDAGAITIKHLSVSSDGKSIAYGALSQTSNLWSVPLSPDSYAPTAPPSALTREITYRSSSPSISPDGKKIAYGVLRAGGPGSVWVINADGSNPTQLTTVGGMGPTWSADGERIVFSAQREGRSTLWSIPLNGGKEKPLIDLGPGTSFSRISPDGKQVVFNSTKSGTTNIWLTSLDGGPPKQLTFDRELMAFPCWSPDGKLLALGIKRGDDNYLATMPSTGGEVRQLIFDHGASAANSWSPDGDKIAFAGSRNGVWNIYWISRTTKEQKQLTNYNKLNIFVRYPAWSPLGNQIVYEYAETTGNIWLMELK